MKHAILAAVLSAALLSSPLSAQEKIGELLVWRDADAKFWKGDATTGPLVHLESGATFPEQQDAFKRTRIMIVDDGKDAMVHYTRERPEGAVELSVFLFQPDNLPEHRLKGSLQALSTNRPGQFVWADGPFTVDTPTKLRLFKGTYKQGIGPDTVMDYLYFGNLGKWTVKVRATLPSTKSIEDEKMIDAAVRTLPWEAILAANGECSGSACQTDGPVAFNHHIGETMLGSLLASGKGKKPKDGVEPAVLSRKEGGAVWELRPLPSLFAQLFNDSYGGLSVVDPIYTLTRKTKKESTITRFFSGLPDQAMFDATVDGLERQPEDPRFPPSQTAAAYVLDE